MTLWPGSVISISNSPNEAMLCISADKGSQLKYSRKCKKKIGRSTVLILRSDWLVVRFNESKDRTEKMRFLELMQPYNKAMTNHIKRSQALDRKNKRVDALYEQIDVERQKECSS
ncbi:hypothetical protein VSQ82_13965 [Pseudomonas sp. MS-1(2024)]|uniref:hypothetical protein n=1 Tax=Pseudomonas sp. MS-1(2024) TaxID=3112251 RepID=UPI002DB76997|nr:hypothetical protein [Pseudomonas sp. MS-1(2024)]MEC4168335.1 hypothetical protein [Pseudomonas sp. MS-1(2024)]